MAGTEAPRREVPPAFSRNSPSYSADSAIAGSARAARHVGTQHRRFSRLRWRSAAARDTLQAHPPGSLVTPIDPRVAEALRDRYQLERELGRGGMATVYLAQDLRHRRQVAVKVLQPELAATLGSDRFFREIEVAARLQHPHILPLLDSGEAAGFYYYVMPYVAGESLRERVARVGELPIDQAVKILTEVVDALAAAHAAGVVHRDIKPDNVMLSGRHAMVMDFGVAKAVSEATGRNQLTTAGVALGTPAYMAPEQASGRPSSRPPGGHLRGGDDGL